jgi:hypothetical protein
MEGSEGEDRKQSVDYILEFVRSVAVVPEPLSPLQEEDCFRGNCNEASPPARNTRSSRMKKLLH